MRAVVLFCILLTFGAVNAHASDVAAECNEATAEVAAAWSAREPSHPGLWNLGIAYLLYKDKNEEAHARSLKRDKRKHCYYGCRIAQETGEETAVYVAWLKEEQDLHDCNSNTHFDPQDESATRMGAAIARQSNDPSDCLKVCRGM